MRKGDGGSDLSSCTLITQDCSTPAWGASGSVFGMPDTPAAAPWELIVQERSPRLFYRAWRRPLRSGLFLYRTRAVFEGVGPAAVRAFHMGDLARCVWMTPI